MARRQRTAILLGAGIMGAGLIWAMPGSAADSNSFKTRLSVVPLDVGMQVNVAGQGTVSGTLAGNRLTVNGSFEGLRSPATEAHIYRGPKGIPGPAILDLTVSKATSGTISGTLTLNPNQLQDLKTEQFYVQLNSERAPEGNLRGWLIPAN